MICMIRDMFCGLDLYYTDPTQHLVAAGWDLDDLDRDLSDLSVRRVDSFIMEHYQWCRYVPGID